MLYLLTIAGGPKVSEATPLIISLPLGRPRPRVMAHSHSHGGGHSHDDANPDDDWNLYQHLERAEVLNAVVLGEGDITWAPNATGKALCVMRPNARRLQPGQILSSDSDEQVIVKLQFAAPVSVRKLMARAACPQNSRPGSGRAGHLQRLEAPSRSRVAASRAKLHLIGPRSAALSGATRDSPTGRDDADEHRFPPAGDRRWAGRAPPERGALLRGACGGGPRLLRPRRRRPRAGLHQMGSG